MKIITFDQLQNFNACKIQLNEFKNRFGDSVEVTEELCVSVASIFDFNWVAEKFLKASAWAEYDRVKSSAWAEYTRVKASTWAEYDRVKAITFAKCFLSQK